MKDASNRLVRCILASSSMWLGIMTLLCLLSAAVEAAPPLSNPHAELDTKDNVTVSRTLQGRTSRQVFGLPYSN